MDRVIENIIECCMEYSISFISNNRTRPDDIKLFFDKDKALDYRENYEGIE